MPAKLISLHVTTVLLLVLMAGMELSCQVGTNECPLQGISGVIG